MVENSFSVCVFCIGSMILAVMLKRYCREQSIFVALAACALIIGAFLSIAGPVLNETISLFESAGISSGYISIILKAAAVCFITQITCDICRDGGENAIAAAAELWGRGAVTVIALPVVEVLLEMIEAFLQK